VSRVAERKRAIEDAMRAALQPVLWPDEHIQAGAVARVGANQNLFILAATPVAFLVEIVGRSAQGGSELVRSVLVALSFGLALFVGIVWFSKTAYVAATEHRVLFLRTSPFGFTPGELFRSDPRNQVGVLTERFGWSSGYIAYRTPEGPPLRLNYGRAWREDMSSLIRGMGSG
jgi:hypothetical protein